MRLRALAVLCALAALPLATARADDRVIAPGVSVLGVDLSNQTVDQASATLAGALGPHLARPVVVAVGGHSFRLRADQAFLRQRIGAAGAAARGASWTFDTHSGAIDLRLGGKPSATIEAVTIAGTIENLLTAKRAFQAGQKAAGQPVAVAPALRHSAGAVRGWATVVFKRTQRPAADATARITLTKIFATHSRPGVSVDVKALSAAVDRAFDDPSAPRVFRQPVVQVRPKVTYKELLATYGTVLTVDRDHFKLRLFKRLKVVKTYPIAVGMAGLDTPAGLYAIHDKQVNPAWHVPNSAWAGSLAGQTIPGGSPDNPLKARWLGIADGVGIHGTAEDWSIGTRASHGCIRMHVSDVTALYPRVPVGTPVLIR